MELDAKTKLKRFCFLGAFINVYISNRPGVRISTCLPEMKELFKSITDTEFIAILHEVLHQGTLVRRDEPIFAYAAYLASDVDDKLKTVVRSEVTKILLTDDDLFLFSKYSTLIASYVKRKGFSKTTRKAVHAWYKHQSPEDLREMWLGHRGKYGFTHKFLIRTCKINDAAIGDKDVSSLFFNQCTALIKNIHKKPQTTEQANKKTDEVIQTDAATQEPAVSAAVEAPSALSLNQTAADKSKQRILALSQLRTTDDKMEAFRIVKKLKLNLDQVPDKFINFVPIVKELIPSMSYYQLLKFCRQLVRFNHWKNPKIFKLCSNILENKQLFSRSNINPVSFLIEMDRIGIRLNTKRIPQKRIQALRMPFFYNLYKQTFGMNQGIGMRMLITMNLQDSYKNKLLNKRKKFNYLEAATALAYSYFAKERVADVFAYTDQKFRLHQIPWTKEMDITEAMNCCEEFKNTKNNSRLIQPLLEGLKRPQIYDLFLVIVPTAGRNNPQNKSDFLRQFLEKYRQTKNPSAKFVIVNLRKYKKSMEYSRTMKENILEICGLDEHIMNLINDFALNRFD